MSHFLSMGFDRQTKVRLTRKHERLTTAEIPRKKPTYLVVLFRKTGSIQGEKMYSQAHSSWEEKRSHLQFFAGRTKGIPL